MFALQGLRTRALLVRGRDTNSGRPGDEVVMHMLKDKGGHRFCRQLATRACRKANLMKKNISVAHEEKSPYYYVNLNELKITHTLSACCSQGAIFRAFDGYLKQNREKNER